MSSSEIFSQIIERRILYVDSNIDQLLLMEKHIEFYNEESLEKIFLETISDPTNAIECIESGNFDLIICDYSMPQLSGIELLEQIKDKGLNIPFILLTGKGSDEIADQAISKGAIYYFDKINLIKGYDELIKVINNAVTVKFDPKSIIDNEIRYKTLFENIDYALMLIQNNVIIECNNKALELFKVARIEILGKKLSEFSHKVRNKDGEFIKDKFSEKKFENIFNEVKSGKSKKINWQFSINDGSSIDTEITFYKIDIIGQEFIQAIFYDITQSLIIERKLLESEQRTQLIIDNSPAVVYIKDLKGRYLLVNKQFELRYNLKAQNIIGKTDFNLFFEETAKQFKLSDNFVLNNKQSVQLEELIPQENGVHTYLAIKFPLHDINDNIIGLGCFSTDITRRKEIEETVKLSEKKYRELIENLGEGIMIVKENEKISFSNKAADAVFGIKEGSLYGKNLIEFLSPKEFKKIREETHIRKSGESSVYELKIKRVDGEKRNIKVNVSPMYNKDDEFEGSFGIIFDITEMKSEQKQKDDVELILNLSSCIYLIVKNDYNYTIKTISKNINKLGYDAKELMDQKTSLSKILYQKDEENSIETLNQTITGKINKIQVISKSGEKIWLSSKFKPKLDQTGNISHYYGIFSEFNELINLEKRNKDLADNFESLSEFIDKGLIIHDENFKIVFINKILSTLLNFSQIELIDKSLTNIISDDYYKNVLEQSKDIQFIKSINYRVSFIKKDGEKLECSLIVKKNINSEGKSNYMLIVDR